MRGPSRALQRVRGRREGPRPGSRLRVAGRRAERPLVFIASARVENLIDESPKIGVEAEDPNHPHIALRRRVSQPRSVEVLDNPLGAGVLDPTDVQLGSQLILREEKVASPVRGQRRVQLLGDGVIGHDQRRYCAGRSEQRQ